jgi:signal transduction histidine kinase/DNA-binding response OmpR family regulator
MVRSARLERTLVAVLFIAAPLLLLAYLLAVPAANQPLVEPHFHQLAITLSVALLVVLGLLALRSHLATGNRRTAALAAGLLGFGALYFWHGAFTTYGSPLTFLVYGPPARLVFAAALLFLPEGPAPLSRPARRRVAALVAAGAMILALLGLNPVIDKVAERYPQAVEKFNQVTDVAVIVLALAAGWRLWRARRSPARVSSLALPLAVALTAEQSLFYLCGETWSVVWWAAHVVGAAATLLLAWGVLVDLAEEEHVQAKHEALEAHVRQRTAELTQANERLRKEIDERLRVEGELQRAKEAAEAASRAKDIFLASMSHEIRTPLHGILGMTGLAMETSLTREQSEYLEVVQGSAESLLALLNDILDFSKIEAGKLDLDPVPFSLRELVGSSLKTLAVRAHEKGLELAWHVPPGVPDALVGDPLRLRQVILNLAGNAIKFTQQGEVVVSVQMMNDEYGKMNADKEPTTAPSAVHPSSFIILHFSVSDTGIGIPPQKQAVIFEAFTQAEGSTTRQYGGTGLGLTISARLVELMGGRIWVESDVGRGSTFHFTVGLPTAEAPVEEPAIPVRLHDLPVLVVDDNATNRRIVEELLGQWGMKPHAVPDAASALSELERAQAGGKPFALALLDVAMPGMDGLELARQVRHRPAVSRTPLLLLTAGTRPGEAARCRELGITGYLMKPVRPSELQEAITRALRLSAAGMLRPILEEMPVPEQPVAPLRILLAEDNVVNQRLAVRLLEKQGHSVTVVGNGGEALAAAGAEEFDLVLMDLEMPGMGGLEATAALRERERATGRHLPVIAMTAHAMKGDRERCLAAGMDGYIPKPVQPADLMRMIMALRLEPARRDAGPPPGLDRREALERAGGDPQVLQEVVRLFLADCPRLLGEMHEAAAAGDAARLRRAAHTLKGSLSVFGSSAAWEQAAQVEALAGSGRTAEAAPMLAGLAAQLDRLRPALTALASVPGEAVAERGRGDGR